MRAENSICCKLHKTHLMIANHSDPSGDHLLTSLQIESSCLVGLTLNPLRMNYSCRATMASKHFGKQMQSQYQAQNIKGKVGLQTTNALIPRPIESQTKSKRKMRRVASTSCFMTATCSIWLWLPTCRRRRASRPKKTIATP